jgi:hypothetical protein
VAFGERVYRAEGNGVRVIAETEVTGVRPWNEGYEVFARRSTGLSHPGRCCRARGVVLSGGVLGTVKLLMKCRRTGMLPGLSPQLGNYVRTNSGSLIQPGQNRAPAYIPIANEVARRLGEKMDGLPLSFIGEALFNTSSTAHILGGCCMGATPDKGGVGFNGEVFGYPNLLVADGSVVPANLGVNPSLTITALSEYVMSQRPAR